MAQENSSINTGDYSKFDEAKAKVESLKKALEDHNKSASNYGNQLNSESVFAGPICDSAMEGISSLNSKISSDVSNFSAIGSYLSKALSNYLSADKSAKDTYLDIKDGKIIETNKKPSISDSSFVYTSTGLDGNSDRDKVYNYLKQKGFSAAGIAGIMGNLRQESSFLASNVQNGMGYSDEQYVKDIKSGKISREKFINDSRGFGIAQWTYPARKAKLYDTLGAQNIDSLEGQLNFMYDEMGENLRKTMKNATNINSATTTFHNTYERSADKSMSTRQGFANEIYSAYNEK